MRPPESFIEQPVRSLQTMLRVIAEDDPTFPTVVPDGIYEDTLDRVTDHGILVLAKPFPALRIAHAMRFLSAQQGKQNEAKQKLLAAEEKLQELRLVDKAKFLLLEHRHMTEEEAHRYIGKQAMDHGTSRKRIAQRILDDYEG